jgi:hypothetical protein
MTRRPSSHALGPHALTHALAMASLLLAPATGWAAPGPQAGVSAAVRGSVLLGEVGQADAVGRAVADGDAVYLGNAIKAGPAAGMQLMLLDQTTVTLGENAELAVDEFIYDPAQNSGQISMNLTKGAFRLVTGGVSDINPANTKVKTPTATIGIRGTIVLANVSSAGTLIALGGPGPNADSRDRVGAVDVNTPQGSVSITRPGFATFVAPGQAPEPPRPLTVEESASLSGGLARDGSSSSESGNSGGGTTTEAGATQAVEESGTDSSESATAATVVSTQTDSTSTATDQTDSNTQSSEYGNNGAQLTSNVLVQQVLAAPEEETPAEEEPPVTPPVPVQLSWAEMLQARGPSYKIARAADLAGLSGTATYTRLDAPLFDISGLDEEARNRLWLTSNFSGLNRVGSYDFSAAIDFALRRASANWTSIQIAGVTGYYTLAADTDDELPPLLAYDDSEQPVFRVEGETNVPTSYFARVRGAFITGTGDPSAAPGTVIQGLGIYVRNGSGGITPLYAGGGRANKDAAISPPPEPVEPTEEIGPQVEPWQPEVTDADFTFLPNLEGGEYGQSRWSDLASLSNGTTVFSAVYIPLDYKEAAEGSWTTDPSSRFDFTGTIDFAARSFAYGLIDVVLSGTSYGSSSMQTLSYASLNGDAIKLDKGFAFNNVTGYAKVFLYNDSSKPIDADNASFLALDLFLATPGRLYHGTSQMTGTYRVSASPTPMVDTFDSSIDAIPPVDPYDIDQSPADVEFVASRVQLTKDGGPADASHYNLSANVSFINREITTDLEIRLGNGRAADSTATVDFSDRDVRANSAIDLPNQLPVSIYSDGVIPGLTLNEIINTKARPGEAELQHSVVYLEGGDTYNGGGTSMAR